MTRPDGPIRPDRLSREGAIGRPPDKTPPSDAALEARPSEITIEGRSAPIIWSRDRHLRTMFYDLERLALRFGLVVHEFPAGSGVKARRKFARSRIDLVDALATIQGASKGVPFDEWAKIYLDGNPENTVNLTAARAKARVALSKLFRDGDVVKRFDDAGNMILWWTPIAPAPQSLRKILRKIADEK